MLELDLIKNHILLKNFSQRFEIKFVNTKK